ncbi:hypothetical protein [Altericroceibacterium endophyticum]|uniref:Uncharacterized protein n=1 Tax=Altericroceibacterium endophyticum TaxID=1808508 RepID=A0A6I4T319_9SPHN|nr:hypothetical protein [Altericroceibacterium endophyticum]MXO65208.1 hypothetical protein [Altericroceibacterium endophyticum]
MAGCTHTSTQSRAESPPPAVPAPADDPAIGSYVMRTVDSIARIRLGDDHRFAYNLMAGSLDQRAFGYWRRDGAEILFTSDPKPVPPEIHAGPVQTGTGEPFTLRVVNAKGRDIAGIDFCIMFAEGAPLCSYTDGGAWSWPADEQRLPRSITFDLHGYNLHSGPMPLTAKAGHAASFILTPNDFGVADFTGATAIVSEDELYLRGPSPDNFSITFQRQHASPE